MASSPPIGDERGVFYPIFKRRELAAGWRYATLQHATNEIRDHSPFPLPVSPFATIFSQREREPDGLCSPAFYRPCVTYSQLWNPIWPGIKGHSPTRGPTPTIVWTAPMATPGTYS